MDTNSIYVGYVIPNHQFPKQPHFYNHKRALQPGAFAAVVEMIDSWADTPGDRQAIGFDKPKDVGGCLFEPKWNISIRNKLHVVAVSDWRCTLHGTTQHPLDGQDSFRVEVGQLPEPIIALANDQGRMFQELLAYVDRPSNIRTTYGLGAEVAEWRMKMIQAITGARPKVG